MSVDCLDFGSCYRMDSVTKGNTVRAMFPYIYLSYNLGGLVLKEEQELAVEALLSGKDVMAVLPSSFGKSINYVAYCS